jgi:hypothetical protein
MGPPRRAAQKHKSPTFPVPLSRAVLQTGGRTRRTDDARSPPSRRDKYDRIRTRQSPKPKRFNDLNAMAYCRQKSTSRQKRRSDTKNKSPPGNR